MSTHSWALSPWWFPGVPASVPMAMRTPSSWARRIVARWTSLKSAIRWRRCAGMASTTSSSRKSSSPAQIVGTTNVPRSGDAPQGVVVGERAVLDAVDAGLDRVQDALQGVSVRSDGLEVVVGDLDRGPQLVERVLDGSGVLGLRRQHRAGGHDLDDVGAVGQLAAHRAAHGVWPVGHLVHAGVVPTVAVVIESSRPARNSRGPGTWPAVDGVPHGHLDVVPAADVAHGRDARGQRPLRRCRR